MKKKADRKWLVCFARIVNNHVINFNSVQRLLNTGFLSLPAKAKFVVLYAIWAVTETLLNSLLISLSFAYTKHPINIDYT